MIYFCKGEDGTIIERKGSKEEPFEFTTQEGILLMLYKNKGHVHLLVVTISFCSVIINFSATLFYAFSEQVHEGLERAIMTMKKAEQALVTINAEYFFDHNNLQGNKANNKILYYEVELVDFTKVSFFYVLLI